MSAARVLSTKRSAIVFTIVAVVGVIADRLTKVWANIALSSGSIDVIPGAFSFRLVFNEGASFGMLNGAKVLFLVITVVVCAAILVYLARFCKRTPYEVVLLGAIFAGALGNAFDRAFYGAVTDFLSFDLINFPVFNVADICITCGMILWVLFAIFSRNSFFRDKQEGGAK
ncbi:MAG: signal peptidase II [Coriobacteriales bacterium]|nr:signal peptidase II [Coriobacteriales bacterium]